MDLNSYIARQKEWSELTFGSGQRTIGIIKHIESELKEIQSSPNDLFEWIDVIILALDGAWRAGFTAAQITQALENKQEKNFTRKWEKSPEDQPTFHKK
jgi:hypothetical protein